MSIPNIFNKIKSKFDIDKQSIMYLCIIIGVGVVSFGLGRLSVDYENNSSGNMIIDEIRVNNKENNKIGSIIPAQGYQDSKAIEGDNIVAEKKYVASKNGKLYYSVGCKAANRIKPENEIWFRSESDALKSGYTASTSCH